jgi:hypothetical protein
MITQRLIAGKVQLVSTGLLGSRESQTTKRLNKFIKMADNSVSAQLFDGLHHETERTSDAWDASISGRVDVEMRIPDKGRPVAAAQSLTAPDHFMDQIGCGLGLVPA